MEAAYTLEEILQAVEHGKKELDRLAKGEKKPVNKVLEERQKKQE